MLNGERCFGSYLLRFFVSWYRERPGRSVGRLPAVGVLLKVLADQQRQVGSFEVIVEELHVGLERRHRVIATDAVPGTSQRKQSVRHFRFSQGCVQSLGVLERHKRVFGSVERDHSRVRAVDEHGRGNRRQLLRIFF